jgi:FkbM family methyltransferase
MSNLSDYKQIIRRLTGDNVASWLHAFRFFYLIKTNQLNFEEDINLLPNFHLQGTPVIDIGANSANWTAVLSRQVGKKGRVLAFEADPYYAMATGNTIRILGLRNVVFFPFGLSDRSEVLPMAIIDENGQRVSGTGKIFQHKLLPENRTVNVKLKALDQLTSTYPELLRATLIKCDVEGFELKVFNGAIKIIECARPIIIAEVNDSLDTLHPTLFDFFGNLCYKSYVTVSRNMIRSSRYSGDIPEGQRPNRVFLPEEYAIPKSIQIDL